jgi:hypothetical protein
MILMEQIDYSDNLAVKNTNLLFLEKLEIIAELNT